MTTPKADLPGIRARYEASAPFRVIGGPEFLSNAMRSFNQCREDVAALLALLDAPEVLDRWLPIESAPKNGTPMWLWAGGWREPLVGRQYAKGWKVSLGGEELHPTHWQPTFIPQPPGSPRPSVPNTSVADEVTREEPKPYTILENRARGFTLTCFDDDATVGDFPSMERAFAHLLWLHQGDGFGVTVKHAVEQASPAYATLNDLTMWVMANTAQAAQRAGITADALLSDFTILRKPVAEE